jgi:hypothetical protein
MRAVTVESVELIALAERLSVPRAAAGDHDDGIQSHAYRVAPDFAAATGMAPPDRLVSSSPTQLRAFEARAPLLSPQQRLDSALVAAGIGVFSSQSLIDLYSAIYDSTDPSDLPGTDAWQVRQAFVGKDQDTRLGAIRKLLGNQTDPVRKEAMRALSRVRLNACEADPKL